MTICNNQRKPGGTLVLAGLIIGAVVVPAYGSEERLEEFPLPHGAASQVVGIDIVQNEQTVSIATLEPAGSIDDTLAFYREQWESQDEDEPGYIKEEAGDWVIVSHLREGHNEVVQLRQSEHGVEGFISVLALEPVASQGYRPVLPPDGQLDSSVATSDFGSDATTSVVHSARRVGEVVAFYRDHLSREGWKLQSRRDIDGAMVMVFEQARQRMELVFSDAGAGSSIVINEVHDDE